MNLKAIFKHTEGDSLEAEIEVNGQTLFVMDEFGGDTLVNGTIVNIELMNSFSEDKETWEEMFLANPHKFKKLVPVSGWQYFAYGEIVAINPVVCDCGVTRLEGPVETNDNRCSGKFIGFKVSRLTAFGS